MSRPTFSVITPSLNQGRFIADAIESVLAQEDEVFEHIVVDGGSTDETQHVMAGYPHLTILRDPGLGQSHAVNLGFRDASSDFIGWLNADDRYVPGAFASARQAFSTYPDADVVYANAETIDEEGSVTGTLRPGPFERKRLLNGLNPIPQPAVFLRAALLDEIGPLDESLHFVMDYELWLRASLRARFVWVDETWAQFRMHAASKTVARTDAFWPEMRAVSRSYGGPYFSERWRYEIRARLSRPLAGFASWISRR